MFYFEPLSQNAQLLVESRFVLNYIKSALWSVSTLFWLLEPPCWLVEASLFFGWLTHHVHLLNHVKSVFLLVKHDSGWLNWLNHHFVFLVG